MPRVDCSINAMHISNDDAGNSGGHGFSKAKYEEAVWELPQSPHSPSKHPSSGACNNDRLPIEILLEIFGLVRKRNRQSDLASCAMVCRQWYGVAIPILWQAPKFAYLAQVFSFADTLKRASSPPSAVVQQDQGCQGKQSNTTGPFSCSSLAEHYYHYHNYHSSHQQRQLARFVESLSFNQLTESDRNNSKLASLIDTIVNCVVTITPMSLPPCTCCCSSSSLSLCEDNHSIKHSALTLSLQAQDSITLKRTKSLIAHHQDDGICAHGDDSANCMLRTCFNSEEGDEGTPGNEYIYQQYIPADAPSGSHRLQSFSNEIYGPFNEEQPSSLYISRETSSSDFENAQREREGLTKDQNLLNMETTLDTLSLRDKTTKDPTAEAISSNNGSSNSIAVAVSDNKKSLTGNLQQPQSPFMQMTQTRRHSTTAQTVHNNNNNNNTSSISHHHHNYNYCNNRYVYRSRLRKLDLRFCKGMRNYSLQKLAPKLSTLTTLNLGGGLRTDITIAKLAQHLTMLKYISLSWTSYLTDFGVTELVKYCKQIEVIDLTNCTQIEDTSLIAIAHNLHKLKAISVAYCAGVTDIGVREIVNKSNSRAGKSRMDLIALNVLKCVRVSDNVRKYLDSLGIMFECDAELPFPLPSSLNGFATQ